MSDEPRFVPWPKDPWNEIIPNLFQGGQIALNGTHPKTDNVVLVRDEFDAVFSFYWRDEDGNGPDEDIAHVHHFIPDGELSLQDLVTVKLLAIRVAECIKARNRVLVRCQAGYNRSGLVVAFALMELGYQNWEAIALIRAMRSPHALHNEHFVRYIMEVK